MDQLTGLDEVTTAADRSRAGASAPSGWPGSAPSTRTSSWTRRRTSPRCSGGWSAAAAVRPPGRSSATRRRAPGPTWTRRPGARGRGAGRQAAPPLHPHRQLPQPGRDRRGRRHGAGAGHAGHESPRAVRSTGVIAPRYEVASDDLRGAACRAEAERLLAEVDGTVGVVVAMNRRAQARGWLAGLGDRVGGAGQPGGQGPGVRRDGGRRRPPEIAEESRGGAAGAVRGADAGHAAADRCSSGRRATCRTTAGVPAPAANGLTPGQARDRPAGRSGPKALAERPTSVGAPLLRAPESSATPTRHARLAASGRSKRLRLGPGAWIEPVLVPRLTNSGNSPRDAFPVAADDPPGICGPAAPRVRSRDGFDASTVPPQAPGFTRTRGRCDDRIRHLRSSFACIPAGTEEGRHGNGAQRLLLDHGAARGARARQRGEPAHQGGRGSRRVASPALDVTALGPRAAAHRRRPSPRPAASTPKRDHRGSCDAIDGRRGRQGLRPHLPDAPRRQDRDAVEGAAAQPRRPVDGLHPGRRAGLHGDRRRTPRTPAG